MKHLKLSYLIVSLLAVITTSCSDDEPKVEDLGLSYTINPVAAKTDIAVGAKLANSYGDFNGNSMRWDVLTGETDFTQGKYGPNVKPALGMYRLVTKDPTLLDEVASNLGQIAEWGKKAKIDYFFTPVIKERDHYIPDNINEDDQAFLNLISGRTVADTWHNDGSTKYAMYVNIQDISRQMNTLQNTNPIENAVDKTYTVDGEKITVTALERLKNFMRSLASYFSDDTYYKYYGRPVMMFREAETLHSLDIANVYDEMRAACKEVSGMDPYIIAEFKGWRPAARFAYVVLDGGPDAITYREMCDVNEGGYYERFYMLGVSINENYKLNSDYLSREYPGIEFIPPVSVGFNRSIYTPSEYKSPVINPSVDGLRERSWVAKMHLPANPMVIIDSFNDWAWGSAIEPTEEGYGNSWGETMLDAVSEEFKVNK